MTALILVDIQNDFMPGGALEVKKGNEIIPIVNRLLENEYDLIVATKDWHPHDHRSFAVTHGKKPGEKVLLDGVQQILWPVHCVENTSGAEFFSGLNVEKIQKVFYKGTDPKVDSYSTFFDNGHHISTGLDQYLKQHGIKELHLAGLATDYCVKYSALDAIELGYKVVVFRQGCRGVNLKPGDCERALEEMQKAGVEVK